MKVFHTKLHTEIKYIIHMSMSGVGMGVGGDRAYWKAIYYVLDIRAQGIWLIVGDFFKGDTIMEFLFAFLCTKSLLNKSLLYKERICFKWEQILSL